MRQRNPGIGGFFVHVFALCGFALAQPIYDWASRQPEFLVAHGLDLPMALLLIAFLSVLLPAAIAALALLVRVIGEAAEGLARTALVGALGGIFVLYLTSSLDATLAVSLGLLAAGLSAFAYRRWRQAHDLLTFAAVAAIAFPLLFLLTEPVRTMAFSAVPVETASRAPQEPPSVNVVLIVLDELPVSSLLNDEGDIDERAFPSFARLARKSTWYPYATTPARGTRHALPSILTGRMPVPEITVPQWDHYPRNLFLWAAREYGDAAVISEPMTRLCPPTLCPRRSAFALGSIGMLLSDVAVLWGHALLPRSLAVALLPELADRWHNFLDLEWAQTQRGLNVPTALTDRPAQWRGFLGELRRGFHFLHLFMPHSPYWYLPDGAYYYLESLGPQDRRWVTPWLNVVEYQRYLAQLQFTDRLLGELLDALEAADLWDPSLVIVAADHGSSFRFDTYLRRITTETLGDIVNVPLFVKAPGQQEGLVDEYSASLIDIAPTIADAAGSPLGWDVDGISLLAGDRPPRDVVQLFCPVARMLQPCSDELIEAGDAQGIVRICVDELRRAHAPAWKAATVGFSEGFGFFLPRHRHSSLIGEPIGAHPLGEDAEGTVELFGPLRYQDVSAERSTVPALVDGRMVVDDAEGRTLAIAVNGVIGALTQPVRWKDTDGFFAALVPPSLFEPGANEVAVYEITTHDDGQTPLLIPLHKRVGAL